MCRLFQYNNTSLQAYQCCSETQSQESAVQHCLESAEPGILAGSSTNDCTQERCCAAAVKERETALNSKVDRASNLRGGSKSDCTVVLA